MEVLAEVVRSGLVESWHRGVAVRVDAAGEVVWSLGDFLLQSTGTTQTSGSVTLVVRVNDSVPGNLAFIDNTATIGDNAGQTASADASTPIPADMTIVKLVSAHLTVPDAPLTYTLIITNNGPGLARDVTLTDTLPEGVSFVSASSGFVGLRPMAATSRPARS